MEQSKKKELEMELELRQVSFKIVQYNGMQHTVCYRMLLSSKFDSSELKLVQVIYKNRNKSVRELLLVKYPRKLTRWLKDRYRFKQLP